MIPDDEVKRVARAMCEEMGRDPDEIVDRRNDGSVTVEDGGKRILVRPGTPITLAEYFQPEARKLIAFQRAWERVKGDQ
jgi:hypothetical protein